MNVPGVEVHAHAFETMARGDFLATLRQTWPRWDSPSSSRPARASPSHCFPDTPPTRSPSSSSSRHSPRPYFSSAKGVVFPLFGPAAVAWLSSAGAATYQHFFVRRQLRRSESEKSRYQQAIHWAAHEMRTPLTAIQGSSEIMTNYSLPEAKQKQLSEMINSESKRLARLIQTFLDVERLAEGQMELKREDVRSGRLGRHLHAARRAARPAQENHHVARHAGRRHADRRSRIDGVRALQSTDQCRKILSGRNPRVSILAERSGEELRVSVRDQGIGMDSKEIKNIFKKFYRTQRAEQSGEVGTGIGLSIVEQIVTHHGGRMEVTSEPGKGSCFTMVLKSSSREEQCCRNY